MFDIESIHALYRGNAIKYTKHFKMRTETRKIKKTEIAHALLTGEIIEQCLDDEPLPSVLILGYTQEDKPLHIAVSIDDDVIWLVTVYSPTLDIWEADYKTRKAGADV